MGTEYLRPFSSTLLMVRLLNLTWLCWSSTWTDSALDSLDRPPELRRTTGFLRENLLVGVVSWVLDVSFLLWKEIRFDFFILSG